MSQQNVSLVQSLYEAFARGDIPAFLAAMDPSIEWDEPQASGYPFAGVHRGLQGLINEQFEVVAPYYLEFAVVPLELIDAGDRLIAIAECRGKGKTSGSSFVARVVHIVTIRDCKVVRIQAYPDTGTLTAATR
jgi:ketosteroid isomerase-like protein